MSDGDADKSAPPGQREYRLGPFVFVSGLRHTANDPWAHRKGEPRLFALFWSIYLMLSALVTIFATRTIGIPQASRFQYGALALLVMVTAGFSFLWPLTRLSQRAPRRPVRSIGADLLVMLVPLQAVIWPMPILTGWPVEVIGGLATLLSCWVIGISGFVLFGCTTRSHAERAMWMMACVLCVLAAPIWYVWVTRLAPQSPQADWLLRWSPFTGIHQLTEAPANQHAAMSREEWIAAAAPAGVGIVVWAIWFLGTGLSGVRARRTQGGQDTD